MTDEQPTYYAADAAMEKRCRANPAKPWRTAWGFGVFEDFATRDEAWAKYHTIPEGWLPVRPFNTLVERRR